MDDLFRDVSRETIEKLRIFESLVAKWTPRINLVSRRDADVVWERHILDSVQMYHLAPKPFDHWLDLGPGGGFPAVVVAIMASERAGENKVTMIESDARKAAFLRTALRETGVAGDVVNERIENAKPMDADVISARALADLSSLFDMAMPHLRPGGVCLFAKGAKWREEVANANRQWSFDCAVATSKLDPNAAILTIKELSRA